MRALTLVSRCREANETSTCRHNIDIGQKIVFWLDFKSLLKYKDNHRVKNLGKFKMSVLKLFKQDWGNNI